MAELPDDEETPIPNKPTPVLDELLGPQQEHDFSSEPF